MANKDFETDLRMFMVDGVEKLSPSAGSREHTWTLHPLYKWLDYPRAK